MGLKVGQAPVVGTSSANSRAAAINHAGPTDLFRQVSSLSGASPSGPEEESLHFGEAWDGLRNFGDRQENKKGSRGYLDGVRFGDILTTEEVSSTLVSYQAMHDLSTMPPVRMGAMLYESSMRAIANNGTMRPLGGTFSCVL